MVKRNSLGRGLDSLLSSSVDALQPNESIVLLSLNLLQSSQYQPRKQIDDDALVELAESIKKHGVIQPILVRQKPDKCYEIIAGERRWRASQMVGLKEIPVIIREISDEDALALGLIENIQRQNLNPIEEAQGLMRLKSEFGLTHEKIALVIGRSRSSITNTLRLLNLPEEIQQLLMSKKLSAGHAKAIISLPVLKQLELAKKAVEMGWSVRNIEKKALLASQVRIRKLKSIEIKKLEDDLCDFFKLNVSIKEQDNKGFGTLTFNFSSFKELQELLQKMNFKK